jgi:hypothetical protein
VAAVTSSLTASRQTARQSVMLLLEHDAVSSVPSGGRCQ